MDSSKEANGHPRPLEDSVSDQQYSALPTTGGGDRMQLIPNAGADRASGSSLESGTEVSPLQMELGKPSNTCQVEGLNVIIISAVSFSVAITVALIITIYFGPPQVPLHGAVSCDSPVCAAVGTDILKAGGSSVDAAIAASFCLSVVQPFSAGIGGGGYMIVRNNRKDESVTIDAREAAPRATSPEMFDAGKQESGMSVAIPGLLRGLEMAHKQYGKLPWATLIQPAIKLANETGFNVTPAFVESLSGYNEQDLRQYVPLHQFLMKQYQRLPMEGDTLFNHELADTLSLIANKGASAFYSGPLAANIASQVENNNGILTEADLLNYQAISGTPEETTYGGMTVQTVAPPGGGPLVLMMLNIMEALSLKTENGSAGLDMHWFAEAQKFTEVESGHLGDPAFSPAVYNITKRMISKEFAADLANKSVATETFGAQWYSNAVSQVISKLNSRGTATVTVIGADEHMVALSMSLGGDWGSKLMIVGSGFIMNSQMAAFTKVEDFPKDPNNEMEPGKRPASYLSPSLVFSRQKPCAVRMALGGGGGEHVPSGVAQVIREVVTLHQSLPEALSAPRVYASLLQNKVFYEDMGNITLSAATVQYLEDVGHQLTPVNKGLSTVNVAAKVNETVTAAGDRRNGGGESVF